MIRDRPRAQVALAFVVSVVVAGTLLSGCSRAELTPAPELVSAGPQLFTDGAGVLVTSGSPDADKTPDGPLWWFTSPEGVLEVYNGSAQSVMVRVSADVVIPCETPARLEFSLPNGHQRTVEAATGRSGRVRFAVRVPARGTVDVPVRIVASACHPPGDPRDLYAGLLSLRARAAGSGG